MLLLAAEQYIIMTMVFDVNAFDFHAGLVIFLSLDKKQQIYHLMSHKPFIYDGIWCKIKGKNIAALDFFFVYLKDQSDV